MKKAPLLQVLYTARAEASSLKENKMKTKSIQTSN